MACISNREASSYTLCINLKLDTVPTQRVCGDLQYACTRPDTFLLAEDFTIGAQTYSCRLLDVIMSSERCRELNIKELDMLLVHQPDVFSFLINTISRYAGL